MFTAALPPAAQYRQVATTTAVTQASPHQLIVLLYDGAIAAVLQARHAVATKDGETRRRAIAKAIRIVDEGLKAALMDQGDPSLVKNLRALYDHMVGRLFQANVRVVDEPLAEVARLLADLRSAWADIAPKAAPQARMMQA